MMDGEGNKVATILCVPRSHIIDCKRCVVEIANRWLYYEDFHDVVDKVLGILPMAITGVNRVDLCCDFEMTDALYDTYKALARGDAYVKGLQGGDTWWKNLPVGSKGDGQGVERVTNCLRWGGKDSVIKWKVYYKWLELQQAPPEEKKPYIQDLWRAMGFVDRHVWRCEVSVNGANALRDLKMSPILPMTWYDDRVRLFCDIYSDKFIVRRDEGHKDRRNDSVLPFLSVDGQRSIRHALPMSSRDDSDPERRVVCKLWRELTQTDTSCNRQLASVLCNSLSELLQRPSNVWAIQKSFGVSMDDIVSTLEREHAH